MNLEAQQLLQYMCTPGRVGMLLPITEVIFCPEATFALQVLLSGLHVEVASHSCGSLSIIVCSDALDIWDANRQARQGAPDARQPAVISIGQRHVGQGRLQRLDALQRARSDEGSASSTQVGQVPSRGIQHTKNGVTDYTCTPLCLLWDSTCCNWMWSSLSEGPSYILLLRCRKAPRLHLPS